jgi:DNA polymerase-3 subunit alpha
MFPPEALRKCRDVLEPGKAVAITVRAKMRDGEVRFFGDDAQPIEKAIVSVTAGLRVHVSPSVVEMESLKARLGKAQDERGGGEIVLIAALGAGREVEIKLPGRYMLDGALRGALKTAPGVSYLEEA